MKIKPLGNRILLEQQFVKEEKTASGIVLTIDETNPHDREKQLKGIIVDIGSKVDKSLGLKKGHLVKFVKHSETTIDEENNLILVKDTDLQAIIFQGDENETK